MQFTETFLSFLKYKGLEINKEYIKRRLESHPEFPSQLVVSETPSELGITQQAFISDKNNPIGLSYPFLAHTIDNGDESFEFIDANAKVNDSFIKKWDGIALFF